jgi:hypothetical protein
MRFYWLVVGTLCVWRITHLFYAEDGPRNVMVRLRKRAGVGFWGSLLDCFYCLSLWIALPFALLVGQGWKEQLVLWPALSAGASLLERATSREANAPPAMYFEDKEHKDVMLREEPGTVSRKRSGKSDL